MNEPWKDKATGKIFCPENDWTCPYLRKDGSCILKHVEEECDVFYSFWENDIEELFSNKCERESIGLW